MQVSNERHGRDRMLTQFRGRAKAADGARVIFAYEASSEGYGLYDDVTDAGFECHVLAPSLMARSQKHRRSKTDRRDSDAMLDLLRAHVLAGNELPDVWIPDHRTRDDREVVRARIDAGCKLTSVKTQVKSLLKRNGFRRPKKLGKGWTRDYRAWLGGLSLFEERGLGLGARLALASYLRQIGSLETEIAHLDAAVCELAQTDRYREPVGALVARFKGVAGYTAMVFLTEMGDLSRFSNRREIGAYLGLVPSSDESGETTDRKGHITHQGSWRMRKALCQAAWSRIRTDERERIVYDRIVDKNPKHKKIATVAIMRRLAVQMWHVALEAQERAGCFCEAEPAPAAVGT